MQAAPGHPSAEAQPGTFALQGQETRQRPLGTPHYHSSAQKSCEDFPSTNPWVAPWGLGGDHMGVASFCGRDECLI